MLRYFFDPEKQLEQTDYGCDNILLPSSFYGTEDQIRKCISYYQTQRKIRVSQPEITQLEPLDLIVLNFWEPFSELNPIGVQVADNLLVRVTSNAYGLLLKQIRSDNLRGGLHKYQHSSVTNTGLSFIPPELNNLLTTFNWDSVKKQAGKTYFELLNFLNGLKADGIIDSSQIPSG